MIKDEYYIKQITYKEAMDMVIKNHYLHRKASCVITFGLFEINTDRIVGCIIYGIPASPRVTEGVCGFEERKNVGELTRLWIEDGTPKNVESYLIGNTIKLTNFDIIMSYAEAEIGHIGIVYQATNWIYTGLTAKRTNRVNINGNKDNHNRHACMIKEDTILIDRPRKHRYIYFNCNKKRKKELKNKLKYKILKYPKSEGDKRE